MEIDRHVTRRYKVSDEYARLWQRGKGDLVRLRTWDIFERFLPRAVRILDVGGGPGTHAAHLAQGYEVTLVDPVPRHVEQAKRRAGGGLTPAFEARLGTAGELPADDAGVDAVLLLGPLNHLVDRADRLAALHEAQRLLRPAAGYSRKRSVVTRGCRTRPSRDCSTRPRSGATSSSTSKPG